MKHNFFFEGLDLILRPLEVFDIESLRILRNQPQNRKWFIFDGEISQEQQLQWYEKYLITPDDYMFAVCLRHEPNNFLGAIAIYKHDKKTGYEVGRLLLNSPLMPRRGMGVEVIRMVCSSVKEWLTNETVIHLYAEVFSDNERSLRCFKENNFNIDGERKSKDKRLVLLSRNIQ